MPGEYQGIAALTRLADEPKAGAAKGNAHFLARVAVEVNGDASKH
jgi:hypothetical protein